MGSLKLLRGVRSSDPYMIEFAERGAANRCYGLRDRDHMMAALVALRVRCSDPAVLAAAERYRFRQERHTRWRALYRKEYGRVMVDRLDELEDDPALDPVSR